jgi:DNA-binding CsgD family transcriptional regulator
MCRLMTKDGRMVPALIINSQLSKHSDGRSREMLSVGIPLGDELHKPELMETWLKEIKRRQNIKWVSQLTKQELEVIKLFCEGKPIAEIALILKIAPDTVKVHRRQIYKKLMVHNLGAMMALAFICGLN